MDKALFLDLYELTMAQSFYAHGRNTFATFDLFVRDLPVNRNYLIAAGLEDILTYIKTLRFGRQELEYLRRQELFSKEFLGYLSSFRFRGDIWAMPEGTPCFANEPILRVTSRIIEAQIIEGFLLNTINLATMIASKASRVAQACAGRHFYDFSLRRTHGQDAGIKVARAAYIAGASGTSCVLAGARYGIPIAGTMAHAFVMSFKRELESFSAYASTFPSRSILLVDTYDTKKGIENAVKVGIGLKRKGFMLQGIRLDSGDIVALSKLARKMLDRAGLVDTKIFASGNLDEYKIDALLKKGAAVDSFGVGTNMGTSSDAPSLDVIYKISEIADHKGNFFPTMKLSKAKVTYPGRKQVFRVRDKRGRFFRDIVGLEKEKLTGKPLLQKVVSKGKIIYRTPPLEAVRRYSRESLSRFPKGLCALSSKYSYPLQMSMQLKRLQRRLWQQLGERQ